MKKKCLWNDFTNWMIKIFGDTVFLKIKYINLKTDIQNLS